jgi:hypothetical protein
MNNAWQDVDIASAAKWHQALEIESNGNMDIVASAIGPRRFSWVNRIGEALKTGMSLRPLPTSLPEYLGKKLVVDERLEEKTIVDIIAKDSGPLRRALGRDLALKYREAEANDSFGRVDLLYIDEHDGEGLAVPVEVKAGIADHKVVGQIDKYVRRYRKLQSMNMWDDALGVVLASGYDKASACALREMGIVMAVHKIIDGVLTVRLIP